MLQGLENQKFAAPNQWFSLVSGLGRIMHSSSPRAGAHPGRLARATGQNINPWRKPKRGISNTTGRNTPGRPVSARGEPKQQGARPVKMNTLSPRQIRKVNRLAKDVVIDTIGDKVVVRPLKRAFGKLVQPSYLLDYIAVEKPRSKTR